MENMHMSITLNYCLLSDGCFQIPTCSNQGPKTFTDQHGVGSTLFTLSSPNPTDPFDDFSTTWQGLQWSLVSSSLDVASVSGCKQSIMGIFPCKSDTRFATSVLF